MKNQPSLILRLLLAICLAFGLGGIPENSVQAATYTFNISNPPPTDSNDINPGDKICLDAAGKCSLRAALQEVNAGNGTDEYIIYLSSGAHQLSLTPNFNLDKSVTINNNTGLLAMIRGITKTGTININNTVAGSHVRMNNVTISEFETAITHKQGLFTCTNCTIQYNKRGISVTGGTATFHSSQITENEGTHCVGASINGGTLTTYSTAFTYNKTTSTLDTDRGGAVCNNNGTLNLRESSGIAYNSGKTTGARKDGGGLYHNSSLTTSITDSSVYANEGRYGGGIYISNGTVYVRSASQIYNNFASMDGGGIQHTFNGQVYIEEDSQIINNTAIGNGGGIHADGDVRVNRAIISGNQALLGGGIYHKDKFLKIDNGVIKNNTSLSTMTGGGGGLFVDSSYNLYITNTTFSGNQARYHGGGIYLVNGYVDLSNVTITNNTCDNDLNSPDAQAGGVYVSVAAQFYMRNSILAANIDPTGTTRAHDLAGTLRSQGFNLIGECGSSCGIGSITTGNIVGVPGAPIDPHLDALTIQNTPRFTFYHPLQETSLAVHAGNPAGCKDFSGIALALDQLGLARVQGGRCDMGAAESPYTIPIFSVFLPLLRR